MRNRKVSARMLSGYILMGLFFVVVLIAAVLVLLNTYIDHREDSEAQMRLNHIAKSIDIQINTAQEVVNSLYWDESIRMLALQGSENTNTEAVCQAVQERTDSASAKNMTVYVSTLEHSLDNVYGAQRASSALSFLKSEGFGSISAMSIANTFKTTASDVYFRLMEQSDSSEGSTLAIVERKMYGNRPIYFFTLVDLNEFVYTQSAADTIMIIKDDSVLACSDYSVAAPRRGMYTLLDRLGDIDLMIDNVYAEGEYQYLGCQSEVMSWYYVLATPNEFFTPLRSNAYMIALAFMVMVLALGIVLAYFLRRYAYAPVLSAVETLSRYTNARCDSEEKYICETAQVLSDQVQSLAEENNDYRQKEYMEYLRSMLRGIKPDEEIERELEQNFCAQKDGPYRVCVLEFSKYAQLSEAFSEDMIYEIRRQIVDMIAQQLEEGLVAEPMVMDYKGFVVISAGLEMRVLRAKLMNVVAMVGGSFEAELAGAVGDLCERLADVGASYASALKILDSHYSLGSQNVIVTSEDVGVNMGGNGLYYPIDAERELIAEVIRCHEEEVARILTDILDENFEKHPLTKDRLNSFAFVIASTVNRIAETLGKSTQEIFGEGNIVFLDLKMSTDKMELRGKVYGMFNTLIEFVQKQTPGTERDISSLMLEYIHEHYNEDISLSDLSNAFSLSLSYTSTLFKEVTGENFKDYLNRYRIKRACDILMQEPGIKNTELARRVGCNTVATLLRLFNKYEGVTPGQYGKKE